MKTVEIAIPYQKRHLQAHVKQLGGTYNPKGKNWIIPDNAETREFTQLIQRPLTGPTAEDRVTNVALTCVELLNAVKHRRYRLVESGDRILIESDPLVIASPNGESATTGAREI